MDDERIGELWVEAMRRGAFEHAWRLSDEVLRRRAGQRADHLPRHLRWLWDGTLLRGKRVLVRSYHGLGDTLQFARFVPRLAAIARAVALEAPTELLPLLASLPGVDRLLSPDEAAPVADVDIELMELPHALRVSLQTLPASVPYLCVPPGTRPAVVLPARRSGRPRVGLVWAGGDWRRERSLPPALLAPLAAIPGIDFVSLQHGAAAAAGDSLGIAARQPADAPVVATAALLQRLDLVITIDTMAAHLAGALGRRVWTLLDADADWRWMLGRADTPWYPTMRLFRQPRPGAWEPAVQRIAAALASSVRHRPAPPARRWEERPRNGSLPWQSTNRRKRT